MSQPVMIGLTTDPQLLLTSSAFIPGVPPCGSGSMQGSPKIHWNNTALSCTELFRTLALITTVNVCLSWRSCRGSGLFCLMLQEADSKVSGFYSVRLKWRNIKISKRNDHSMCRVHICMYPGTHFCWSK